MQNMSDNNNRKRKAESTSTQNDKEDDSFELTNEILNLIFYTGASADLATAVLGGQSTGKSSFLKCITQTDCFPSGPGTCTTYGLSIVIKHETQKPLYKYELNIKNFFCPTGSIKDVHVQTNSDMEITQEISKVAKYFKDADQRSYTQIGELIIRGPSVPMNLYDFPGCLSEADENEAKKICSEVNGHANPTILAITNGDYSEHNVGADAFLRNIIKYLPHGTDKMIVVVTNIDKVIARQESENPSAVKDLTAGCLQMWKNVFKGEKNIDITFALVQTGSKDFSNLGVIGQEEIRTIEKLKKLIPEEHLLKGNGEPLFIFGVPEMRKRLSIAAFKGVSSQRIEKIEIDLTKSLEQKRTKIESGKRSHKFEEVVASLCAKLRNEITMQSCMIQFQEEIGKILTKKADEIFDSRPKLIVPKQEPQFGTYMIQTHGVTSSVDDEIYAKEINIYIKRLASIARDITEAMLFSMAEGKINGRQNGLKEIFSFYQDYETFSAWLKEQFDEFSKKKFAEITSDITTLIADQTFLIHVRQPESLNWPNKTKFFAEAQKDPMTKRIMGSLITIFGSIQQCSLILFSKKLLVSFPDCLYTNIRDSQLTEIKELSDEEIQLLENECGDIERRLAGLERIKEIVHRHENENNAKRSKLSHTNTNTQNSNSSWWFWGKRE